MKLKAIAAASALASAMLGTAALGADAPLTVPFDFSRHAIGLDVTVKGAPLYMILDTGVDPSAIDLKRAEALGLPIQRDNAGEASGEGDAKSAQIFGDDWPTPDGTCVRDYIHVQDLASAHLAALARLEQGETLGPMNLGTGRGYSVREVIAAAERVLGKPVPHVVGPRRAGDPAQLVADPSRAKQRLGWEPQRSDLETIVEDTLRSRSGL